MNNECIPFFEEGDRVSGKPTVAVTGKKFVRITGNRNTDGTFAIGPPAAAGRTFGVAGWDAGIGVRVPVLRERGMVLPVTCAADLAAWDEVEVDNTGAVVPFAAGVKVGVCVTAALNGTDAQISLY